MTLSVFIGSSSEEQHTDLFVRATVEKLGEKPVPWRQICPPSTAVWTCLLDQVSEVDAALLIATPDDLLKSRGVEFSTPRDNVLFELGMFLAGIGPKRTAIVQVRRPNEPLAKLPSDLEGITTLVADEAGPNQFEANLSGWLASVRNELKANSASSKHVMTLLSQRVRHLHDSWREDVDQFVLGPMDQAISSAVNGEIVLTIGQYFQALYRDLDRSGESTEITAVSLLSAQYWVQDREQRQYFLKNLAARKRGARMRRLFVVSDESPELQEVFLQHVGAQIEVRRVPARVLGQIPALSDMVSFRDKNTGMTRTYLSEKAPHNPSRLRLARLLLPRDKGCPQIDAFEQAWTIGQEVDRDHVLTMSVGAGGVPEPAANLKPSTLDREVITCEEAARAKSVPLERELKSLILVTSTGFVALHLRGDQKASLRKVKRVLESDQASMASERELSQLGLMPGTVCAIRMPVWGLLHLIDRSVLMLDWVTTNDGTRRGFYRFAPAVLLEANEEIVGDFAESPEEEGDVGSAASE